MRKKNRAAEIVLIIAMILFIVFAAVTYKNLALLSEGMEGYTGIEATTEVSGE